MNIIDKTSVPVHLYKIGRGTDGRETRVHGTNPVRFPVVRKWKGAGFLEAQIHDQLQSYHFFREAGTEWFDLEHVQDNVGKFLDECVLKALRGNGNGDFA